MEPSENELDQSSGTLGEAGMQNSKGPGGNNAEKLKKEHREGEQKEPERKVEEGMFSF